MTEDRLVFYAADQEGFTREAVIRRFEKYTASRKAMIVIAIEEGIVTEEEMFAVHMLSYEELSQWRSDYKSKGWRGLKTLRPERERV